MSEKNPLIEALPPATDYLTYLTIIEYNLNPENLPVLHRVLQDTQLTVNIGWDLVHLLVPLLPNSDECLQDIASLGNPREVILKVTEALRLIDFQGLEPDTDDDDNEPIASDETKPAKHPAKTAAVEGSGAQGAASITQAVETRAPPPLPVLQFTSLLSMLSTLHSRIRTPYPSRFLSTTLQAILASFSNAVSHHEELLSAIVQFIKNVSGTKRPNLPPRRSSTQVLTGKPAASAPDPEADTAQNSASAPESAIQKRLFQAFITHVFEDYMLSLSSDQDAPGLAWCSRLQEKLHPERTIPKKSSMTDRFIVDEALAARLTAVGGLVALARDLGMERQDLLPTIQNVEAPSAHATDNEDEFPQSAEHIPLSKAGSLFLFAAANVATVLYSTPKPKDMYSIFPEHQNILQNFIAGSTDMGATIGTEPEAVIDAILALALLAVEDDHIGEPADNEQFSQYLQFLSLVSSNSPSPSLRYHAFYLATTILRSNPSDVERLAFIRDTLEHCPFDNLKVAAISWVKGETIEANPPTPIGIHRTGQQSEHDEKSDSSVFATPVALDSLAPFLFPDLTHDLTADNLAESWVSFEQSLHFYLASLNFYYLLLSAQHLHEPLAIGDLHSNNDVAGSFLHPLRIASSRFKEEGKENGELHKLWEESGDANAYVAELSLLDATLDKVTVAVARLNQVQA